MGQGMAGFSLAGRTVLLTGAGRGIGRALFMQLAAAGAKRVIAVGRDAAALDALSTLSPIATPYPTDLADPAERAALVAYLTEKEPDLSVVINNAGTQLPTDLVDPGAARYLPALAGEIAVNFAAPIDLCVGLLPGLIARPSAMIVNITSGLAIAPKSGAPVYCAAKAGLRSFTKALRYQAEARAPQLRIVEALPPLVDTEMTRGRGRGKISAEAAAAEIVHGMEAGKTEIYVGKAKLLRAIHSLSPALADRLMRAG